MVYTRNSQITNLLLSAVRQLLLDASGVTIVFAFMGGSLQLNIRRKA